MTELEMRSAHAALVVDVQAMIATATFVRPEAIARALFERDRKAPVPPELELMALEGLTQLVRAVQQGRLGFDDYEDDAEADEGLHDTYPRRPRDGRPQGYARLSQLSDDDLAYHAERLRASGLALKAHAETLREEVADRHGAE